MDIHLNQHYKYMWGIDQKEHKDLNLNNTLLKGFHLRLFYNHCYSHIIRGVKDKVIKVINRPHYNKKYYLGFKSIGWKLVSMSNVGYNFKKRIFCYSSKYLNRYLNSLYLLHKIMVEEDKGILGRLHCSNMGWTHYMQNQKYIGQDSDKGILGRLHCSNMGWTHYMQNQKYIGHLG